MKIRKNVKLLNCKKSLTVVYVEEEYTKKDCGVVIYDTYKISILLTDGLGAVVNNKLVEAQKNCILFFRPDEIHFGRFFRDGVHKYIDIYIPVDFFDDFCRDKGFLDFLTDKSKKRINCIKPDLTYTSVISGITKELCVHLEKNEENDMRIFSLILDTIFVCNKLYTVQKESIKGKILPKFITKTVEYINENFSQKISLSFLAERVGCSVAYLSRVFKIYTQTTVYDYITSVRILNAKNMLKNGATVTEACFYSGFEDCSNFIKLLKKSWVKHLCSIKKKICIYNHNTAPPRL